MLGWGHCGPDCPEEDDGKEFDEEVPPLSTNKSKLLSRKPKEEP